MTGSPVIRESRSEEKRAGSAARRSARPEIGQDEKGTRNRPWTTREPTKGLRQCLTRANHTRHGARCQGNKYPAGNSTGEKRAGSAARRTRPEAGKRPIGVPDVQGTVMETAQPFPARLATTHHSNGNFGCQEDKWKAGTAANEKGAGSGVRRSPALNMGNTGNTENTWGRPISVPSLRTDVLPAHVYSRHGINGPLVISEIGSTAGANGKGRGALAPTTILPAPEDGQALREHTKRRGATTLRNSVLARLHGSRHAIRLQSGISGNRGTMGGWNFRSQFTARRGGCPATERLHNRGEFL